MRLDDANGSTIVSGEQQKSVAVLFGGALGIDWQLFPWATGPLVSWGVVLSTGLKRLQTGPMDRVEYASGPSSRVVAASAHDVLQMWIPFVGATIAMDSRAEAREVVVGK